MSERDVMPDSVNDDDLADLGGSVEFLGVDEEGQPYVLVAKRGAEPQSESDEQLPKYLAAIRAMTADASRLDRWFAEGLKIDTWMTRDEFDVGLWEEMVGTVIVGSVGAGKTTMLHCALDALDDPERVTELSGNLLAFAVAFDEAWESASDEPLNALTAEEAVALGRRAGTQAAVTARWRQRLGDTFDTAEVTELLGISRQALDSRKRTGSVLALPGAGTSHYPIWQFDIDAAPVTVRALTQRLVTAFREAFADISPLTIAAWATSPQPELDDRTPAEWITNGEDEAAVVTAAQRAAHLEAQ